MKYFLLIFLVLTGCGSVVVAQDKRTAEVMAHIDMIKAMVAQAPMGSRGGR